MKSKQNISIIVGIIIALIIITSVTISNPQLIDRAFYRMGFQEQVCLPIVDERFQSEKYN